MLCLVCGAPDAEPHFGGISCRACAAFFRRYFHSKKTKNICTCTIRFQNSHPCRECRIQKCLSIGMDMSKVQEKREKHTKKRTKPDSEVKMEIQTSESPPSLPISPAPLLTRITSRDTSNISNTVSKWLQIQPCRSEFYQKTLDQLTYYETCCASKMDISLVWKLVKNVFPQVDYISFYDEIALRRNFLPKWSLLASSIDFHRNQHLYKHVVTLEDYEQMIIKFYRSSMLNGHNVPDEEILRVFEPFLRFYGLNLALPVCRKEFNDVEYMALALLMLFDAAYTNISPECSEVCHQIRKVILRELRGYNLDQKKGEMRFIDTVDTLTLVEKGEAKFQEELLVCEMYNVNIHEDFRILMRNHNY